MSKIVSDRRNFNRWYCCQKRKKNTND